MAYIFDPIRNTFVDDEDTSLGNKLALKDNDELDKVIRQLDEQFGPGTTFPASEAPIPPKTIERDMYKNAFKESAADGGMIGGGTIAGQDMGNRTGFVDPKLIIGGSRTPPQFKGMFGVRTSLTVPENTQGYLGMSGEQAVFATEADAQRFIDEDIQKLNKIAQENKKRSPVIEKRLEDIREYVKNLKASGSKKIYLDDIIDNFIGSKTVFGTGRYQDDQTEIKSRVSIRDNIREALGDKEYNKLEKGPGGDRRIVDEKKVKFNKLVQDVNRGDLPILELGSEARGTTTNIKQYLTANNKKRFDKLLSKLRAINSRLSQPRSIYTDADLDTISKTTTKTFNKMTKDFPSAIESRTLVFKGGTRFYDAKSYALALIGRHVEQGGKLYKHVGGDTMKDVKFRNTKTNKLITIRNMDLNSPEFKEVTKVYNEFEKLKNSQIDNPLTGEKISLNNAIKEGSGGKDYIIIDHTKGIKKSPLKNLIITTQKQNIGFELAGLSDQDKKRFYREKVDFDTNLDRFTKYGQRLLTKGNYKKPTETVEESRSLLDKIKSGASSIKNKMDATKMLSSKIPGGAIALTPLDFTMSMASGMPLAESLASAGSYLIKDPYLGRAVNVPLAIAQDMQDPEQALAKGIERGEKAEAFLQDLVSGLKEGAGDQPDIDPFQAAEGGRVGFNGGGAVGADDDFAKELEYFLLNPDAELPKADSYRETMNPVALVNDMIDPRNYAYYADRLAETGVRIGEFGARVLPALGQLTADLIKKPAFKFTGGTNQGYVQEYTDVPPSNIKGTGIFTEFLNNLVGTEGTKVITEKTGLADLIKSEEQKQKDKRSTIGPKVLADQVTLGAELTAPIFPGLKLLKAYAKNRKLPVDDTTRQVMEKEIDEVLATQNITRRDFLKVSGAGGAIVIAKMLGFGDELATATKVAEKVTKDTVSGIPTYFPDLISIIKTKGKNVTKRNATKDLENVYEYKGFDLYEDVATGSVRIEKLDYLVDNDMITERQILSLTKNQGDESTKMKPADEYEEVTEVNSKIYKDDYNDPDYEEGIDIEEILRFIKNEKIN